MEKNYTQTNDGTYTLYSKQYNQNYHSTRDGALSESLYKHVIPTFEIFKDKQELKILDICFGLGYNTLATIYYCKKNRINTKLYFYSPELDGDLIKGLEDFTYPDEFKEYVYIIKELITNGIYKEELFEIELYIGDAREYIKNLDVKIDVVYQDAFSSEVNHELWTKEYFSDIKNILSKESLITTYSIATPVRLSMYENNLRIYEFQTQLKRKSTLGATFDISTYLEVKYIDMEKKKQNNPMAKPLVDNSTKV